MQQVEECLRDLAAEARKKHPGVKEASERATLRLRALQNQYIAAVRASNQSGAPAPTTALFQSSELLHPFLLAANYPNANSRLLSIAFRAMRLLMEAKAVLPSDAIHLVRVWMIQAQVVAGHYQKVYRKELKEVIPSPTSTSSSSSWFGWSSKTETPAATTVVKNAVSSSSGQAGTGHQTAEELEQLAKDILGCLLQLIDMLKSEAVADEVWSSSVALGCVFFESVPARHRVREASRSTLMQVLQALFSAAEDERLAAATWNDLLILAAGDKRTSQLAGAFYLCKKTSSTSSATAMSFPPSAVFALELMTDIWPHRSWPETLVSPTMSTTLSLLSSVKTASTEHTLRIVQWTTTLLEATAADYPNECRELLRQLIRPIATATDACRSHHDFEDGYVYSREEALLRAEEGAGSLACFLPTTALWKAGMCLEAVYSLLGHAHTRTILVDAPDTMAALAEALSDFATIAASCRDHMLGLVEFAESLQLESTEVFARAAQQFKPSLFRKAEAAISSGSPIEKESDSTRPSESRSAPSSANAPATSSSHPTAVLGESLWIALQGVLRIAESLQGQDDLLPLVEEIFAPSLAVLQHYLKRFAGCKELIQLALKGYSSLADVCVPIPECTLQRKALLTSLCKLSLPSWGKQDASCLLQDNHVRTLLFLFRIVHSHYDAIASEWDIILRTFEELSVMAVASSQLSDESYHAALAVSAVFDRFAAFSTCFSTESLLQMVEALTDIAKSAVEDRDVLGDSDTVIPQRASLAMVSSNDDKHGSDSKDTISGKIMSIGVRAIYGTGSDAKADDSKVLTERTKNTYYEEYRRDFAQRLSSTKSTVRVGSIGRIPFSIALLVDVIMANFFRSEACGDRFSEMLSTLASSSPAARPFTMDIMSMLTMSQVSQDRALPVHFMGPGRIVFGDPMQSQLWAVEPTDQPTAKSGENKTQAQLLAPICHTMLTTEKAAVAESALGALTSILEGVGHNLNGEVWSEVIEAVGSLSGDPAYKLDRSSPEWSSCCLMAFRSLKFIVDDFLDQVSSSNDSSVSSLLDCCSSFGSSRHDVNTSLTAVGLLWTIADQDAGADSIDRALSKLVLLAKDNRPEVRNASVNTLFSCIAGRGGTFSRERWESCFTDSVFSLYEVVVSKSRGEEKEDTLVEPSSRYKVSLHHSRDSASKQWCATQVVVLRGLIRVLRNFFHQLLDTTDENGANGVPWFQDAWVKLLDYAFEAASQGGGRDTLDIRSVGVELLVLCCQLSSKAGIQAAATPARVGTNMEVVNGALRSVREAQPSNSSHERTQSAASELSRQSLFLESFEGLESYKEYVEKLSPDEANEDKSLQQVLHKFAFGLAQLFECCKEHELAPQKPSRSLIRLESNTKAEEYEEVLEVRFVRIVATITDAATVDHKSRFLNQTQRACFALLQAMAVFGSLAAFKQLVSLAGEALLVRRESDDDYSETPAADEPITPSLLSIEASTIVSEEVVKDAVSDECKALVLYQVLCLFTSDDSTGSGSAVSRPYYKRIVPIISSGLAAVSRLNENPPDGARICELVWTSLLRALSRMLSPIPIGRDMTKISRVGEVVDIINTAKEHVPSSHRAELCTVVSYGASKSFEVAKQHDGFSDGHSGTDKGKKSLAHRNDLLKLFSVCLSASCSLQPEDALLRSITKQALSDALHQGDGNETSGFTEGVALTVCKAMTENKAMDSLVLASFSLLCKLLGGKNTAIREAVGDVFEAVDVSEILVSAQKRYEDAESRADEAEAKVKELSATIDKMHKTNESLRRDVAALEASL